ncbi:unnamed protein product [Paramecium sonneborni]|uniref:Uncharacterized protein n=1 Tax=Paramecium sonneborni TaxID=65129 RepID=A0A8S1RTQ5_9CILI|nr:unnamed protein product [Paramecium sonneborni]
MKESYKDQSNKTKIIIEINHILNLRSHFRILQPINKLLINQFGISQQKLQTGMITKYNLIQVLEIDK